MARKWWGTVNLPAVVDETCSTPWYHVPARAETRWMVHLLTWRMGRKGGVGWVGMDEWIGTVFGTFMD
jgi:hypothetical protein